MQVCFFWTDFDLSRDLARLQQIRAAIWHWKHSFFFLKKEISCSYAQNHARRLCFALAKRNKTSIRYICILKSLLTKYEIVRVGEIYLRTVLIQVDVKMCLEGLFNRLKPKLCKNPPLTLAGAFLKSSHYVFLIWSHLQKKCKSQGTVILHIF